ncbi:hypothetical protein F4809DRAFT_517514 [Biscogniauxia mediterranea]|nr:hypothetical protein F4809DRAFT_517514 [Biscogniauxia mediterranea]
MATTTTTVPFIQEAQPGTDIWKKPPTTNVWNASITRTATGRLSKFLSARVSFRASWTERYDQAGLLLVPRRASSPSSSSFASSPPPPPPPDRWVKAGVEYYEGAPQLSTVCCDRWADWSVAPLLSSSSPSPTPGGSGSGQKEGEEVTIEAVREGDENGKSVWVYRLVRDAATGETLRRVPMREICWILADEDDDDGENEKEEEDYWVIDVSPLVARPEKSAAGPLKVEFSEFAVAWLP